MLHDYVSFLMFRLEYRDNQRFWGYITYIYQYLLATYLYQQPSLLISETNVL